MVNARKAAGTLLLAAAMAVVMCISALQLDMIEAPVALTARWTNDYQSLLNREASNLPSVDVDDADAPNGVEYEDDALLASAKKEQNKYIQAKEASGLAQAKGIVQMAKETNAKFGGTFRNGVGSNTWAGTPYAKYDDKDMRTESLKVFNPPHTPPWGHA